ncbi:hypothetical protein Bca52824_089928 [Brassica carinata]|uniref:SHSP domain-containing protein n=1 Tax=Brassica carinata TaxID=52824 RepID=A0A8X7NVV9_BRACI|nr:hypothetical protein Bca52824_089928 [Brassica carinata]
MKRVFGTMAYESKQLESGSLYVRLDMPGVPKDNFNVSVSSGRVKVTGQAPAVSHDSDGRFYSGDVAMLLLLTFLAVRSKLSSRMVSFASSSLPFDVKNSFAFEIICLPWWTPVMSLL